MVPTPLLLAGGLQTLRVLLLLLLAQPQTLLGPLPLGLCPLGQLLCLLLLTPLLSGNKTQSPPPVSWTKVLPLLLHALPLQLNPLALSLQLAVQASLLLIMLLLLALRFDGFEFNLLLQTEGGRVVDLHLPGGQRKQRPVQPTILVFCVRVLN